MAFRVTDLLIHASPKPYKPKPTPCPNPQTVCPASTCPSEASHCRPSPPSLCDTPTKCPGQASKPCNDPSHCNHPQNPNPTYRALGNLRSASNLRRLQSRMNEMLAIVGEPDGKFAPGQRTPQGAARLVRKLKAANNRLEARRRSARVSQRRVESSRKARTTKALV